MKWYCMILITDNIINQCCYLLYVQCKIWISLDYVQNWTYYIDLMYNVYQCVAIFR